MKYYGDRDIENGMIVNDYMYREEDYDPDFYCDMCGEPVYEGDVYFKIGNDRICECCIEGCKERA